MVIMQSLSTMIVALVVTLTGASAQDQPADLVARIDALPAAELAGGPAQRCSAENLELVTAFVALVDQLRELAPDEPRLPGLMRSKWSYMTNVPIAFGEWDGPIGDTLDHAVFDDVTSETSKQALAALRECGRGVEDRLLVELERIVAGESDGPLARQAYYPRARILVGRVMEGDRSMLESALAAFDGLMAHGATTDRKGFMAPRLLSWLAESGFAEDADPRRLALLERLVSDFPESSQAARVAGKLLQLRAIGKPFELEFDDAMSGAHVSIKDLRDKVVLLDFWATWCVPCIAEMPHVESLEEKYGPRGLVIVGLSLDDADALGRMRDFVTKHALPWAQFHVNGSDPEFGDRWGISTIPHYFVIDRDGRLHASVGSGEQLDSILAGLFDGK